MPPDTDKYFIKKYQYSQVGVAEILVSNSSELGHSLFFLFPAYLSFQYSFLSES